MSQPLQSALQQSIRSALGCANDFNGDLHAMCDLYGIVAAPISGRLIEAARKFDSSITTASSALNYFLQNPQNACGTLVLDFTTMSTLDPRITFSRGSQATLFDSTGTLVYAKHNLLLHSEAFDNAAWTKSQLQAFGSGSIANATTAPDGTVTADKIVENTTTNTHLVQTVPTYELGVPYTYSVFAKASERTFVQIRITAGATFSASFDLLTGVASQVTANTTATIFNYGNGWYRCCLTFSPTVAGGGASRIGLMLDATTNNYLGDGASGLFIWGAQLNLANMEGGVTSSLTTYYPTTTAAYYAPRFDYNLSTLQPRGLLIEEQRTNLIRNSTGVGAVAGTPGTAPTNWVVGSSATHASSIIGTGVENGINYVDIQYVVSAGAVAASLIYADTPAATASTAYTGSYFLKLVSGSIPQVRFIWQDGITTVARSFFSITSSLTRYDNTYTTSVGATLARFVIGIDASAAGTTFVIRVGLPQTEQGAFATSVIPTTTTALTRNADVASMTGTNFSSWYNQTEGTLFAQFMRTASANTQQGRVFSLSDGSNVRIIEIYQTGATNPAAQIGDSGSQAQWTPTGFTVGLPIKEILAYKLNDSNASFNGSAETPDTVCTIPTVNQAQIGNRWDGLRNLNGYVQRLAYYPTRLPNATLVALTS